MNPVSTRLHRVTSFFLEKIHSLTIDNITCNIRVPASIDDSEEDKSDNESNHQCNKEPGEECQDPDHPYPWNNRAGQINIKTSPTATNPCFHTGVVTFLMGQLGFTAAQIDWLNDIAQADVYVEVIDYLNTHNYSPEAVEAMILAIEGLSSYNESYFPGMDLGYEYQWWLDDDFIDNNFTFNFNAEGFSDLTYEEKILINFYPLQALAIMANKEPAETETENRFGNNGLNDMSDAFRHAFFNAMNSNDVGELIARLFSNAHESENPRNLILEEQMDLFNNNIGHNIGANTSFFANNQELSNSVYLALIWGSLRYLSPIWPPKFSSSGQLINPSGDPNFYGTNGTNDLQTATHGLTSNTQLTPTNQ